MEEEIISRFENLLLGILEDTNYLINYRIFETDEDVTDEYLESFWEPVIVRLSDSQINSLEHSSESKECSICTYSRCNFNITPCCQNDLCVKCANKWFEKSVFCPYCKADIRDYSE